MFGEVVGRVAARFARAEPRRQARAFLAELPRKNSWTIAEHAGRPAGTGWEHLLARAAWDADGVPDDLQGHVVEHFGDPDAVPLVDEAGGLEKGRPRSEVQRQYSGR